MTIPDSTKLYPRTGDRRTIYLKNAVQGPDIEVGDLCSITTLSMATA